MTFFIEWMFVTVLGILIDLSLLPPGKHQINAIWIPNKKLSWDETVAFWEADTFKVDDSKMDSDEDEDEQDSWIRLRVDPSAQNILETIKFCSFLWSYPSISVQKPYSWKYLPDKIFLFKIQNKNDFQLFDYFLICSFC